MDVRRVQPEGCAAAAARRASDPDASAGEGGDRRRTGKQAHEGFGMRAQQLGTRRDCPAHNAFRITRTERHVVLSHARARGRERAPQR